MAAKAVVIRHLPDCRPVASLVVLEEEHTGDTSFDTYAEHRMKAHMEEFMKTFIEFKKAEWYLDIIR